MFLEKWEGDLLRGVGGWHVGEGGSGTLKAEMLNAQSPLSLCLALLGGGGGGGGGGEAHTYQHSW